MLGAFNDWESSASDDLPWYLGWLSTLSVVVVLIVQLLAWGTVRVGVLPLRLLGVTCLILLAAVCLGLLGWVYWRIQLDPHDRTPYRVAIPASATTVGICTIGFAAITTVLIQRGAIATVPADGAPGLLRLETTYAWQLVDSIPFLGVTDALHWTPPVIFSDTAGGAMLLAFKILLLLPLLRVLVAGLRLLVTTWAALSQHARRFSPVRHPVSGVERHRGLAALDLIRELLFPVVWTAFAYCILIFAVRRSSFVEEWLNSYLPPRFKPLGLFTVSLSFALPALGAWIVCAMAWEVADEWTLDPELFARRHSWLSATRALAILMWQFVLALFAATAVTLVLLHAGPAYTDSPLAASREVSSTLEWFSWHIMDAIPVLDVTHTLNWTISVEFEDRWSGVLLVLLRALFLGLLLVPVALIVQLMLRQAAQRRPHPPQVDAARQLTRLMDEGREALDRAESSLSEWVSAKGEERETRTSPWHGDGQNTQREVADRRIKMLRTSSDFDGSLRSAGRILEGLHNNVDKVLELFGPGEALEAGRLAVDALSERAALLRETSRDMSFESDRRGWEKFQKKLQEARLVVVEQQSRYERLAAQAFTLDWNPR
ncbi:hypothetical protein acdb102_22370 [Acidothermaceae bacterium B102]|nr:hypothetical protein acdb102_22370 [Acidothermaceae bacterium B102]